MTVEKKDLASQHKDLTSKKWNKYATTGRFSAAGFDYTMPQKR